MWLTLSSKSEAPNLFSQRRSQNLNFYMLNYEFVIEYIVRFSY